MTLAPYIRIILRYLIPVLPFTPAVNGVLASVAQDPEFLQLVTAGVMAAGNETWYALAKRKGGAL